MNKSIFNCVITTLLVIGGVSVGIEAQNNAGARVKKKHIIGGIWASSLSTGIPCNQVRLPNKSKEVESYVIDSLTKASTVFQIKNTIGLAFVDSTAGANAVKYMSCEPIKIIGVKQWLLLGDNLFQGELISSSTTELTTRGKLYLATLLGHEIAHFSQHESGLHQNRREAEFHSDFFGGWYLYNYIKTHPEIDLSKQDLDFVSNVMSSISSVNPGPCQSNVTYPIVERRKAMNEAGYKNGELSIVAAMKKAEELTAIVVKGTPNEIKCGYKIPDFKPLN